jgi:ubiquinone biosynthesis protein
VSDPTPETSQWRRLRDTVGLASRITLRGVPRGMLALGAGAVRAAAVEGPRDLHWKATGDALVEIFRSGGPALTKVGQILATGSDLLPAQVCARLEVLYDRQPAMSPRQIRRIVKHTFGRKLPWKRMDRKPLAVGSIGQVHRAELPDGRRVVVKVLRRGVRESMRRDLNALQTVVEGWARLYGAELGEIALRTLAEFEQGLERETDFTHEAAALEEFGKRLAGNPRIRVPFCHQEWCSSELLVLEELVGTPLSELRVRDPDEARRVASLALKELLTQVFDQGRYHADPHAGNLLLLEDGRLGLIDLGLTGELTKADRRRIARAARAILSADPDRAMRTLLEFGSLAPDFDQAVFKSDVARAIRAHPPRGPGGLDVLVQELLVIAARHGIVLPPSTSLLIKTLVTIEGVARSLDPDINVLRVAFPVVVQSLTPAFLRWRFWSREANASESPAS